MSSFISQLNWRFATKKFDPEKKVPDEDLQKILDAIRYAPTSMGFQPFRLYIVSDIEIKKQLYPISYNQPQVLDSSHLLIFCARTDIKKRTDEYVRAAIKDKTEEEIEKVRNNLLGFVENIEASGSINWAAKQAYIALGFGLAACAELQIDSSPMEGFVPEEVDKILNLPDDIKSLVYLAVGYRLENPRREKFRFSEKDLFKRL